VRYLGRFAKSNPFHEDLHLRQRGELNCTDDYSLLPGQAKVFASQKSNRYASEIHRLDEPQGTKFNCLVKFRCGAQSQEWYEKLRCVSKTRHLHRRKCGFAS